MKKFVAILATFTLVISLSSCSYNGTYDDGYEDGYDDGYSDAESEMQHLIEEEFFDGYDIGYEDGEMDGRWLEEDAIDYVREHSKWHPEDALVLIEAYRNNEPFYEDGSVPSEQDYIDAIDSLIYFYDYFYSARYK